MYKIVLTGQAVKDARKIEKSNLKPKVMALLELIENDPYAYPPPLEFLHGEMEGLVSRRINRKHRLVYEVIEGAGVCKVYRMWTHYE